MLNWKADSYNGVIVEAEGDTIRASFSSAVEFEASLVHSLATWKEEKKRGIWLKLSKDEVAKGYASAALAQGFQMHSVVEEALLLTNFLSNVGSSASLPKAASHYLGVGVVCINDANEILVVLERTGPTSGMGFWKLPTGQVDVGEDLGKAAVRELKEETGIDAEFDSILTFRHMHNYMFKKGDLFFVCMMKLPAQKQALVLQETEIAAAQWMPLHEVSISPIAHAHLLTREAFLACYQQTPNTTTLNP